MLHIITGEEFTNGFLQVDNMHFKQCVFRRCKLIFHAEGKVAFTDCVFTDCQWVFDGPAETTLRYLSALYRDLGQEGKDLVEAVFQSIRDGTIGDGLEVIIRPAAAPVLAQ